MTKSIYVKDVVEIQTFKGRYDEGSRSRGYQDGFNSAVDKISDLPISESKLKKFGWVKCLSEDEIIKTVSNFVIFSYSKNAITMEKYFSKEFCEKFAKAIIAKLKEQ